VLGLPLLTYTYARIWAPWVLQATSMARTGGTGLRVLALALFVLGAGIAYRLMK